MCGIFGIEGHEDAANIAYLGLYAQQHRGQEIELVAAGGRHLELAAHIESITQRQQVDGASLGLQHRLALAARHAARR